MNEFNLALEPQFQPCFSKAACQSATETAIDSRDLFHKLIHISGHYDTLPQCYLLLKRHFQSVNQEYLSQFSSHYSPAALSALLKRITTTAPSLLPDTSMTACLLNYAPIYFTEPCWLGICVQTATNQSTLAIDLLHVYLRLTAGVHSVANSREIYHAHLLDSGLESPAFTSLAFAKQSDINDEAFDFAVIQLALGHYSRVLFPEILGFTLSYCQSPSLLEQYLPEGKGIQHPRFIDAKNEKRKHEVQSLTAIIKAYLAEFEAQADILWHRIQTGFWLYQQQLERFDQRLGAHLHGSLSPRQAMEKLVTQLAPNAIGHHGKIRLGGKTIDEWFKETPFKSANFLASLLHTPYIDRNKPEASKLLQLFEFNGPMFGVLDAAGKNIVKDWLLSELNPGLTQGKKHITASYKVGLKSITSDSTTKDKTLTVQLEQQANPVDYTNLSNRGILLLSG